MIINRTNLDTLFKAYNGAYRRGILDYEAMSEYGLVTTETTSTTAAEVYPWLGQLPGMKEWVGERIVENLRQHDFTIRNKDWEQTVAVPRNAIEDDQYGVYSPFMSAMGTAAMKHYDELVWPLLKTGFSTLCYDGQNFFDADHPALDKGGGPATRSNADYNVARVTDTVPDPSWFLLDLSQMLKPVVLQIRKRPDNLIRFDREDDELVFMRKEFVYGVDCRDNVGFGLWQGSYGSNAALNPTNYEKARVTLLEMKGDYDRPLGIKPTHLVVPPSLEKAGLEILNAERNSAGATNVYRGTAELHVARWLA
ncbi:MAG: Mu-like prophage major head subunit gpT family protein [Acidobacteriota bacterium]|nr:Mu-like prophage major head subunit gpT family protein [Acidobacteriota bacterium]